MSVQPDGKVVVAGTLIDFDHPRAGRLLVARFLPDGRPDPAFGSGGTARLRLSLPASANAIAVQPDGRIVAAGYSGSYDRTHQGEWLGVARLTPDGRLDPTFDEDGFGFNPNDFPTAVAMHPEWQCRHRRVE